jgi:hypothetical protein
MFCVDGLLHHKSGLRIVVTDQNSEKLIGVIVSTLFQVKNLRVAYLKSADFRYASSHLD